MKMMTDRRISRYFWGVLVWMVALSGWAADSALSADSVVQTESNPASVITATVSSGVQPRPVKIVYFYPTDCKPFENHRERIDRTMRFVQDFYLRGMRESGFGDCTFALERDADSQLVIHYVPGEKPRSGYGRDSAWNVRNEVKKYLAEHENLDIENEVIVLFQTLLAWNDAHTEATELGPYVGWGTATKGTAWVYDDPLLDATLLSSKEPGGYYHGACSIGEFNSHYVGGIAHELGHGFSLPHDCERNEERERGNSLMGSGNHTMGTDLRGEGRGSFLSKASATRLATIRAFDPNFSEEFSMTTPKMEISHLNVRVAEDRSAKILVSGVMHGTPQIKQMVLYHDNESIPSDYDAITWVSPVNNQGEFAFAVDDFWKASQPAGENGWAVGRWQMRLVGCHEGGATSQVKFDYSTAEQGPDLTPFSTP